MDTARSIPDELAAAVEECGDKTWLRFVDGDSYTFREMRDRASGLAAGLSSIGLRAGDRIALLVENRVEFVETWLAAQLCGAVPVVLNTAMRGSVLARLLDVTAPRVVVAEVALIERVLESGSRLDYMEHVVGVPGEQRLDPPSVAPRTYTSVDDLRRAPAPNPDTPTDLPDICTIMYTSGTTGRSRGVIVSQGQMLFVARQSRDLVEYTPDDVIYACLPLFHMNALATCCMGSLTARCTIVLSRRFSVSRYWSEVASSAATITNLVGATAPLLLRQEPSAAEREHSLRTMMVIPALPAYFEQIPQRFGVERLYTAYGSTEMAIPIWNIPGRDGRSPSCGSAVDDFECRLVDDRDEPVAIGEVGELVVRPRRPWIMSSGYWGMPEETVTTWRNLWFHTGDLFRQDADGDYYFVDRVKDAIRVSGENISSFEVEEAVLSMDGVAECAAYALPSEFHEDDVAVAIVLEPGAQLDPLDLTRHLETRLPYYAVPRYVWSTQALPKTQTEKVKKQELRDRGVVDEMWDRKAAGYKVAR